MPSSIVTNSGFHEFDGGLYFNEFSGAIGDDTLFKLDADGTLTPLTYINGATNEPLVNAGGFGGFVDFAGSTYFAAELLGARALQARRRRARSRRNLQCPRGGAFDANLPGGFVVFNDDLYFDAYGAGGDSLYQLAANGR